MTTHQHTTAIGVFTERAQADRALEVLHNAGFTDDMIGFIQRDLRNADTGRAATDATKMPATADDKTGAAATGAVGGGILGGLLGAAAALVIPGIGPAIAGGILVTTLGGAAIGAVAGGLIGALTNMGIPEEEARYYQQELESGRTLVTVNAGDRYDEAVTILRGQGAYDVHAQPGSQQPIADAYDIQNTDPRYTTNEQRTYNRDNYPVTNVEQPTDAVDTSYTGSPVGAGAENYGTNYPQQGENFQQETPQAYREDTYRRNDAPNANTNYNPPAYQQDATGQGNYGSPTDYRNAENQGTAQAFTTTPDVTGGNAGMYRKDMPPMQQGDASQYRQPDDYTTQAPSVRPGNQNTSGYDNMTSQTPYDQRNVQAQPYNQNDPAYDQSAQQRYNQGIAQSETQSPYTQDQARYGANTAPGNDPYRATDTYGDPNANPNMAPRESYPYEERTDTNTPGSNQPNNPQRRREFRTEEMHKENTPPPADNQY